MNEFSLVQERAALAAASADPHRYVEKRKPLPDPQVILLHYITITMLPPLSH